MSGTVHDETPHAPAPVLGVERSVLGKNWRMPVPDDALISQIVRQHRLPEILARILAGRGLEVDAISGYLAPRLKDSFPDPSSFKDMDLAAQQVWDAIEAGCKVAVFADYDVDGATSAAQLLGWAKALEQAWTIYVPDRVDEGYGPNTEAFRQLQEQGVELVITVDCGAAAHQPLQAAADMGLAVIVVDHHLMDDHFPPADALINPNRPDDESGCGHLAAAGVSFVFLAALNREGRRRGAFENQSEPDLLGFLDLAALGTICDVVPLHGFNRAIVAQGLKVMSDWSRPGLKALAQIASVEGEASTYHAGFVIGPRINAGGRVGQSDLGTRLLSSENAEDVAGIASELDRFNRERREIEARVLDEAMAQVQSQAADRSILVAAGDGWHPGVIGVVAGRIKERFDKPAIVIGIDRGQLPALGKGSGRSVEGVNLGGAIAAAREAGLLLAGGGHAMAGGLTVDADGINALVEFLDTRLEPELAAAHEARMLKLDGILSAAGVTLELVDEMARLAPFGQGNPEPRIVVPELRVAFAKRVGTDHVRVSLAARDGTQVQAICFRCADTPLGETLLAAGDGFWHVAGRVKINEWQGRKTVQLQVEDMAAAIS